MDCRPLSASAANLQPPITIKPKLQSFEHLPYHIPNTKMSSSLPAEIASTIQSASIKRDPSPHHDINPSTSASEKVPVNVSHPTPQSYPYDDVEGIDEEEEEDDEDIPYSVLKPIPRRRSFGPMPDLRFEQSYLSSIKEADTNWKIAFITIRDQVYYLKMEGSITEAD